MNYLKTEDEELMCLMSQNGPENASETFDDLEKRIGSLKGRKFYGLFKDVGGREEYNCCVRIEPDDDPEKLGLERMRFESGRYDRELLNDWSENWDGKNIVGLPEMVHSMIERNRGAIDMEKYSVEFYRSQKELYFYLPLK